MATVVLSVDGQHVLVVPSEEFWLKPFPPTRSSGWYLEKVEVQCATSEPPLLWEVHVRRWVEPGEVLAELRADPCVWEEWDMQVGMCGVCGRSMV